MSDKLQQLHQRIQAMEDIEAIKQLKYRYWFSCDSRDIDGIRDCFDSNNLLIDFGFIGQFTQIDDFIAVFEQLACHSGQLDMHHGSGAEIKLTGPDTATGRWRMRFQLLQTKEKLWQLMNGYYQDSYSRVDGQWKITKTKHIIMSNLLLQTDAQDCLKVLQLGSEPGLVTE